LTLQIFSPLVLPDFSAFPDKIPPIVTKKSKHTSFGMPQQSISGKIRKNLNFQ